MKKEDIERAKDLFGELLASQEARIEGMKNAGRLPDYSKLDQIVIGYIPGDGIGPGNMEQALRVVKSLLAGPLASGRIVLREIPGLSIDERAKCMMPIPPESRAALEQCHVILKSPLDNTSVKGLPSSVAAIRRELGLSINIRPVSNPNLGIDWVMFRENIEGAYLWSSKGIRVDDDLSVDFVVETRGQSLNVAEAAFAYARKNGRKHVTAVTKNNVVRLTDGNFLNACREVHARYPEIEYDERLVDITSSKLTDREFTQDLEVLVLPNLYGDIVSDVAAEICGGVGTAGSANIGTKYALFESIHGTAMMLMKTGRGAYADPSSLLRAAAMMLNHIGYTAEGGLLNRALDICGFTERKLVVTSFTDGASTKDYTDYILETIERLR